MKLLCYAFLGIIVSTLNPLFAWATPDPNPDLNATVVYLRTSCDVANSDVGESPMENCFENMGMLHDWIYARANPSAKLLIDVGPGQFDGFGCHVGDAVGNVGGDLTFRGAGVGKTILSSFFGISNESCVGTKWAFENMTIQGQGYGVVWVGRTGGETIWTNVLIQGNNGSWYEQADHGAAVCNPGQGGKHLFFSSRLTSAGFNQAGFINRCGDDWFWGSEISVIPNVDSPGGSAILSEGSGNRMHLYGSNVRVELATNATPSSGILTAMNVFNGAELHSHGVGIDVVAKAGWTAIALKATNTGEIHAFESSYFFGLSTAGITVQRILNNGGHVHAPFLWAQHPTPPVIQSMDGADTAIVTSGTLDNHPHMVVYDSSCTTSKWYDMTDKACRP